MKKSSSILLTLLSGLSFSALLAQERPQPNNGQGYGYDGLESDTLQGNNRYSYDPDYNPYYDPSQPQYWLRFMLDFNYYGPYYYPYYAYSYYPYYYPHYRYGDGRYYYGPRGPRTWYGGRYSPGMRYAPGPLYGPRNSYAYRPAMRPGGAYARPGVGLRPGGRPAASYSNSRPGYSTHAMTRRGGFGNSGSHSFGSARG